MRTFFRVGLTYICLGLLVGCGALKAQQATTNICEYDHLIKTEAQKIGWDWRMIASIIYHESNFKPYLVNSKGAFGLMQLMPRTMKKYGITQQSTVEEQLEAGGKVLVRLDNKLSGVVTDSLERVNFILASYNVGMNRVMSYRELAQKNGHDPNVWFNNVEHYCPKQTKAFVKKVNQKYSEYKSSIE